MIDKQRVLAELARTPFHRAWWAPTGLLQTIGAMRASAPTVSLRSEVLATVDGDELHLHTADAASPAAPTVLLLHGLEGSRHSPYVHAMAQAATARGWRFVVLEFRSCSGVPNRCRRTYHSGETTDLAFVVATLVRRWPASPLLPIGYSLGGNVLLKWLGENGDAAPANVRAAAAVSPPFDLGVCSTKCDSRYGGAIARHFLRTLIPKAITKEQQFPGCIDVAAVRRCRTFRRFDDLVTAPMHGFRDAVHYYTTQSSAPLLPAIRRPTLLLAAADDPLLAPEVLPQAAAAASPFLVPQFPAHGGHVGFIDGGTPWRPRRWAEVQVARFFAAVLSG